MGEASLNGLLLLLLAAAAAAEVPADSYLLSDTRLQGGRLHHIAPAFQKTMRRNTRGRVAPCRAGAYLIGISVAVARHCRPDYSWPAEQVLEQCGGWAFDVSPNGFLSRSADPSAQAQEACTALSFKDKGSKVSAHALSDTFEFSTGMICTSLRGRVS